VELYRGPAGNEGSWLSDGYDGDVRLADDFFGRLIQLLAARGLLVSGIPRSEDQPPVPALAFSASAAARFRSAVG
jgi:hypothetical protein